MWKEYSLKSIKNNKATSVFIALITFLSSLFLSLIIGVFYNLWCDYIHRKIVSTGETPKNVEPMIIAYAFILFIICSALIAMIHNAFEISMDTKIRQTGILQSIGATPRQICKMLLQEVFILCLIPIVIGVLCGAVLCYGFIQLILFVTSSVRQYEVMFQYHIGIALGSILLSIITVWISAWMPAKKIGKLSPLEAIHYGGEPEFKKIKQFRTLSFLFGIEGELARKSLYSRKKAFRTSTIALTLSFLGFLSFMSLETISRMSTQATYFERYRYIWDLLLTVKDHGDNSSLLSEIRDIPEVQSCIAYKKSTAYTYISKEMFSDDLNQLGGIESLDHAVKEEAGVGYEIEVPLVILDTESFQVFSGEMGETNKNNEDVIIVNRIWDSIHSERVEKRYIPFLKEVPDLMLSLSTKDNRTISVLIHKYVDTPPTLKEEYNKNSLVMVVSEDYYQEILQSYFSYEEEYFNILVANTKNLSYVEEQVNQLVSKITNTYTLDNRIEEEKSDIQMRNALSFFVGSVSTLFASIGITNVFSNTLGQLYQRRKEFARYFSIGMSPKGFHKMLMIESLMVSFPPVIFSIIINIPIVFIALNASYLSPYDFLKNIAIVPILLFVLFIVVGVYFAYFLGEKRIYNHTIIEVIRDNTMI